MSVQQEKFKQIADVLRSFNASIKKIKPSDFANKFAELHEAALLRGHENGKTAEQESFWDTYQQYGMRTGWVYAFYGRGWTDETYNPKYPISTSGAFGQMFGYSNITDTVVPLNFAYHASTQVFRDSAIKNIPSITVAPNQTFSNWFVNCSALENITFVNCEIQQNISFSHATKLTHDCLVHILNTLADKSGDASGTEWVCTLGATNLDKLTATEIAVATEKGWILT